MNVISEFTYGLSKNKARFLGNKNGQWEFKIISYTDGYPFWVAAYDQELMMIFYLKWLAQNFKEIQ